jgi:5-hydroxyisourate hydrolase-like protein (transthyretin family)
VAGAGDSTLALWLEDEAGNADAAQAAEPVHLRLDDVAPSTGGFELQDPADPRRVSLLASDVHSGLAGARIELRQRGGSAWRALPTTLGADGRAAARIPDAELPDGTYELRALIRDAVGNETLADRDVTGRPMVLVLPLRLATRIVGRSSAARRCRTVRRKAGRRTISRRVCRPAPSPAASALREPLRPGFGRPATLAGVLETWQGRPVAGAPVDVFERPRTARAWRRAGAARTDSSGRFSWRIAAGPSRHVRLAFDGDDLLLPASLEASVLVPAAGTLRADRRRAHNGQGVVFTGRLRGLPLPPGGRTVDLQAHYRGTWRTFATPRTDKGGRWRQSYRFGATRGRVVYRFRALIKRDGSYPYEQGTTPTVKVTVTG